MENVDTDVSLLNSSTNTNVWVCVSWNQENALGQVGMEGKSIICFKDLLHLLVT